MLINLSNHPSTKWDEKQKQSAIEEYGWIEDIPFPAIDPAAAKDEVAELAQKYLRECLKKFELANIPVAQQAHNEAVHIQGEFTFVYHLVNLLKKEDIKCVASTTERIVEENDNKKIVSFKFVQFREYN